MSGLKFWLERGSYSLINRLNVFFFGLASFFVLVRYLDKSSVGIYSIYMVLANIVEMSRRSFLQNAFTNFFVDQKNDKGEVFTASLVLNILVTLFFATAIIASSSLIGDAYKSEELSKMLLWYSAFSFAMIPSSQIVFYFTATVNFKIVAIISFSRYFTYFMSLLIIFFFFPGLTLLQIIIVNLSCILLSTLVSLMFYKKISVGGFKWNKGLFKSISGFGRYIFGVGFTGLISKNIDQLMIGYFFSSSGVATYNLAKRFLNLIEVPVVSLGQLSYSKMAGSINSGNPKMERGRLFSKSTGIGTAIIAPLVLMIFLFPSFFINIVAGEQYLNAVPILQVLIVFYLTKPLSTQSGAVLEVSGKPQIGFRLLLLSTIVNVVLNYFLINMEGPFGGIMGAAIAAVISGLLYLIFALYFVKRESNFSFLQIIYQIISAYKLITNTVLKKLQTS